MKETEIGKILDEGQNYSEYKPIVLTLKSERTELKCDVYRGFYMRLTKKQAIKLAKEIKEFYNGN